MLDAEVALTLPSARRVEWGLWATPGISERGPPPELCRLAAARVLLHEVAAAPSLDELLHEVRQLSAARRAAHAAIVDDRPDAAGVGTTAAGGWTLRVERLSAPADGAPRAAVLCAVAQCLEGPPALCDAAGWAGESGVAESAAEELLVLQGTTAVYVLARVAWAQPASLCADGEAAAVWRRRAFKFEAATDFWLARVALSLCGATRGAALDASGGAVDVFDPCAGSGTIVFAAASIGLSALGADTNARFVERAAHNVGAALAELRAGEVAAHGAEPGARGNARAQSDARSERAGEAQLVGPRDARAGLRAPLPARPLAVAVNLPWGRGVQIALSDGAVSSEPCSADDAHADSRALRELLRGIGEVGAPGARHALVSGAPIDKALRDCGFTVLAVVPVGARALDGRQLEPLCFFFFAFFFFFF